MKWFVVRLFAFLCFLSVVLISLYSHYLSASFDKPQTVKLKTIASNFFRGGCNVVTHEWLLRQSKQTFKSGMPKIVHFMYQSSHVPVIYVPLIEECVRMNPDVTFVMWTDLTLYNLVVDHMPEFLSTYQTFMKKFSEKLKRADIARNVVLYKIGGIYSDMDTRCLKPFREMMDDRSCVLTSLTTRDQILFNVPFHTMNCFMYCVPHHNFFRYVLSTQRHDDGTHILHLTGPFKLTDNFNDYAFKLTSNDFVDKQKATHVDHDVMYDHTDAKDYVSHCQNAFTKWKKLGCEAVKNETLKLIQQSKAFVRHLGFNLGYSNWNHAKMFHVRTVSDICSANVTINFII